MSEKLIETIIEKKNEDKRSLNNDDDEDDVNQSNKKSKIDVSNKNEPMITRYMPMKNGSVNVNKSFKSPFINRSTIRNNVLPKTNNEKSIDELREEIEKVDKEIIELEKEGFKIKDLDILVDKLHQYNDIKDVAQTLLEKMAHLKCVTIREMHEIYGLDPEND